MFYDLYKLKALPLSVRQRQRLQNQTAVLGIRSTVGIRTGAKITVFATPIQLTQ